MLVLEGRERKDLEEEKAASFAAVPLEDHLNMYLEQGLDKKEAMKRMAKDRGLSKREIYQELLKEGSAEN